MPALIRYGLDPTGINLNNLISNEVHELSNISTRVRAVAPIHGAFFKEGLIVYDHITNTVLTLGTDYVCSELMQEATLKYGKEIILLILIINETVSNTVRLQYQTLGGLYQHDAALLKNIYESALLGNVDEEGSLDWKDIVNKPDAFNPAPHNHLLSNVFGFEALNTALERIRNAIVLTDIPAFEALITWVKAYVEANNSGSGGGSGSAYLKIKTIEDPVIEIDPYDPYYDPYAPSPPSSYTLINGDDKNTLLKFINENNTDIVIPHSSSVNFRIGTNILIGKNGKGNLTFVAEDGVDILTPHNLRVIKRYGKVTLIKTAIDTWEIEGNLEFKGLAFNPYLIIKTLTEDHDSSSYTLEPEDAYNTLIRCNRASDFIIRVPYGDVFEIGANVLVGKNGPGNVIFEPDEGVTILTPFELSITVLNGKVTLIKTEGNIWELEGNLSYSETPSTGNPLYPDGLPPYVAAVGNPSFPAGLPPYSSGGTAIGNPLYPDGLPAYVAGSTSFVWGPVTVAGPPPNPTYTLVAAYSTDRTYPNEYPVPTAAGQLYTVPGWSEWTQEWNGTYLNHWPEELTSYQQTTPTTGDPLYPQGLPVYVPAGTTVGNSAYPAGLPPYVAAVGNPSYPAGLPPYSP